MRDVVVVGGGPAGAAAAARLASAGIDVLVLDRAAFPRRKPCGECVNPAAVAALDALGALPAVLAAGPAMLRGWRISAADGDGFDGGFPMGMRGLALPRTTLDAVLLAHAVDRGAEVRTGVHVTGPVVENGVVVGVAVEGDAGETEIGARLVIGADGLRSVVVRRLGLLRRGPRLWKLALTAHVRGVDVEPGRGELRTARGECVGIADVGDGTANVSLVLEGERMAEARGGAEACFDAALERYGIGGERVDAVLATGPFDCPVRSAIAPGALLVGDAAGYYDPFTGQGIFRALRGAELAAETAAAALRAGDVSPRALRPYERARRAAFGPGERIQRVVESVVSRPRLFGAVARRFHRRPALADAVIAVTGDVAPARSLLAPGVLAGVVGLVG